MRCFVENKIPTQMNDLTLQKYKAVVKGWQCSYLHEASQLALAFNNRMLFNIKTCYM